MQKKLEKKIKNVPKIKQIGSSCVSDENNKNDASFFD